MKSREEIEGRKRKRTKLSKTKKFFRLGFNEIIEKCLKIRKFMKIEILTDY